MISSKHFAAFVVVPILSSISYKLFSISQEPQIVHEPQDAFMTQMWKYWSDQEEEVMNLELTPSTQFKLPSWLDGEFLVAGPSKFGMGDKKFDHVLDGFGRYNRFKIDNNTVSFSTKMLDSKWYKAAIEQNEILPGFTFKETNPPRWKSSVPFANFYYSTKYFDNNWVMPSRMPDGVTYLGMTDMPLMLELDIEKLEQKGFVLWEDKLECTMGTTHVKNLPNGDMVGICSEITTMGEKFLTAYRIKGENIRKREVIGKVPTEGVVYQHAFGMSEDYVAIFQHPVNFNFKDQILGHDMMKAMEMNSTDTTKIHLISIADGTFKTFDTGIFFQMIHTGNSFVKDGKFIVDATIYTDKNVNVYEVFEFQSLKKGLKNKNYGNIWRRFEIDLSSGILTQKDLSILEWGNYEVPTFNLAYDGVKENCFTYLMELMSKQEMDDSYAWDMVKFDSCSNKIAGRWSTPGHLPNEAYFIENPQGESEDDGVLVSVAYDYQSEQSKLLVVDAKTMQTAQEYVLPFRIPWTFHSGFWRK